MLCPHCNSDLQLGITKCPHCTGSIGYASVDSETKFGAGKGLAVIGAITFPLFYHFLIAGDSFDWYIISSLSGALLGFIAPWIILIPEKK